jgi:hypothetical protein
MPSKKELLENLRRMLLGWGITDIARQSLPSGQRAHSVDMDRGRCPIIQTTQKRRLVEYRMRDIVNKSEIDMDQLHAQVSGRKNLERTF